MSLPFIFHGPSTKHTHSPGIILLLTTSPQGSRSQEHTQKRLLSHLQYVQLVFSAEHQASKNVNFPQDGSAEPTSPVLTQPSPHTIYFSYRIFSMDGSAFGWGTLAPWSGQSAGIFVFLSLTHLLNPIGHQRWRSCPESPKYVSPLFPMSQFWFRHSWNPQISSVEFFILRHSSL